MCTALIFRKTFSTQAGYMEIWFCNKMKALTIPIKKEGEHPHTICDLIWELAILMATQ